MADWRDGAEYAPIERPEGFATPRVSELSRPEPRIDLAAGQPPVAPDGFAPNPTPVPPLEALVPSEGPQRDPRQAFDSASAAVLTGSAWGAAHSQPGAAVAPDWTPDQPLVPTGGVPAVADPTGFAPPTGAPVAPAFPAPSGPGVPNWAAGQGQAPAAPANQVMAVAQQLGYPLVLVLLAGTVLWPLSLVLLLTAVVLAFRARIERETLVRVHAIAAVVAVMGGLFFPGTRDLFDAMNRWAALGCLGALLVSAFLVHRAMARR